MAWSLSGSIVTQTGTDTDLSGLSAIVGVTTTTVNNRKIYNIGVLSLRISGTLTINPRLEQIIAGTTTTLPTISSTSTAANLTIGQSVTQNGAKVFTTHPWFVGTIRNTNTYVFNTQNFNWQGGTFTWHEGSAIFPNGASWGQGTQYNSESDGAANITINEGASIQGSGYAGETQFHFVERNAVINGLRVFGLSSEDVKISLCRLRTPPKIILNGSYGLTSFTSALRNEFLTLRDYQGTAMYGDARFWDGCRLRFVNSALGTAHIVKEHTTGGSRQGIAEFRQEVTINTKTSAGVAIGNSVSYLKDVTNVNRVNYTFTTPNIDYRPDNTYIISHNATTGIGTYTTDGGVLVGVVARTTDGSIFPFDRRGNADESTDLFTVHTWNYGYQYATNTRAFKGNGGTNFDAVMVTDSNVTLSESNARAKLASSFVINPTTKTVTVTANSNYDDLYDVLKAYKVTATQVNLETPSIDKMIVSASGSNLTAYTGWTLVVNTGVTLAQGTKFNKVKFDTVTLNGTGNITGVYSNNITTSETVTATNGSNVVVVTNLANWFVGSSVSGTGLVAGTIVTEITGNNVKLSNNYTGTTGNASFNVVSLRTSTVLTISGFPTNSAVYVEDNSGSQKFFNANCSGSVIIYIPPTASGPWYYAVEKFGNQRQSDFFTFSGGQKSIVVKDLPDNKIILNQSQITALTTIDNPDEVYDAIAVLRTQLPYISFGQIVSKDGSTLYGGDYDIKIKSNAPSVCNVDYDAKLITLKSSLFEDGPVCTLVKVDVPKTVTAATTETITVNIEDANGDSTTEVKGVSGSLVDVWKCVNGTINVDYATGTKIASDIGAGKFRFIHQDGYKLIFFDKNTLMARDCSMSKGTYTLGWYVYNDALGGLDQNQSEKFEHIYSTLDVVDGNVVSVKQTVENLSSSSGATLAEIEASAVIAMKADIQAVSDKVDTKPTLAEMVSGDSNLAKQDLLIQVSSITGSTDYTLNQMAGTDFDAMNDSLDAISAKVDSVKITVEDKTGYSLTTAQIEAIATAVETHLLDEGDSQMLINAIVGAIGNANIDETALVAAIRSDIERAGGKVDAIKTKVDTLENYDQSELLSTVYAIQNQQNNISENQNNILLEIQSGNNNFDPVTDSLSAISDSIDVLKSLIEDKTGYSLTNDQVNAIAIAVESHLLNEGDSQQLINAIVTAIGNSNVDETILVAAIRADLERAGGKIAAIPTNPVLATDPRLNHLDADISSRSTLTAQDIPAGITVAEIEASEVLAKEATLEALATATEGTTPETIKEALIPSLTIINEGVKKASNFKKHNQNL